MTAKWSYNYVLYRKRSFGAEILDFKMLSYIIMNHCKVFKENAVFVLYLGADNVMWFNPFGCRPSSADRIRPHPEMSVSDCQMLHNAYWENCKQMSKVISIG